MVSKERQPMNAITSQASPVAKAGYNFWLERGLIPDWLIRIGIRRIVASGLRRQQLGGPAAQAKRLMQFIDQLRKSPIAIRTEAANAQHYEVPTEFYRLVLGPQMKYSCCLWNQAATNLDEAEEAMLDLTCHRALLQDGQDVLELGCGWGSLSLFMAARYPKSRILTVSNLRSQKQCIDAETARRGLTNLQVITADMNEFATERRFDRIVSVEMFEHMRNYLELMRRIGSWARPGALLFVHIFTHQRFAYPYEVHGPNDWMAEHFFTGGVMPSDDLLLYFQDAFRIRHHWRFSGDQYRKTSEAWLERLDRHKPEILGIFAAVYGKDQARNWLQRWRVFFLACAEMFGYKSGNEWLVSHYLFENRTALTSGGNLV
jgi:cyclopropane-fatty-acyl-phospholipid synthase